MFKSFMGIFKKDKKDDKKENKDKAPKESDQENEKEEADEKQIDDLLKDEQMIITKNSPFFFFLEKDEDRKIVSERISEEIQAVNSTVLWDKFDPLLRTWE